MSKINVAILGLGNIGTGTYKLLEMNKNRIKNVTGKEIEISKILEKNVEACRDINVPKDKFTQEPKEIFNDKDISIVIELIGGVEPATSFMIEAMNSGKHVVTANKAAVAANYHELLECAKKNNVKFKFEASVGGGIPILSPLTTELQCNEFVRILGIVNGTTNYILTQMSEFGLEYEDVLKVAQEKGFAEADPTADVEGIDVANKLSILMAIAFNKYVKPEDIPTQGISNITKEDIKKAKDKKSKIKLLASAELIDGKLEYKVAPMEIHRDHPLASVNNEFNAVFVEGNAVGELMFYGKGAGPLPTASAIWGDILNILKN